MFYRYFLSLTLVFSLFTLSLPTVGYAQTPRDTASKYAKEIAAIEEKLEKRRQELGVPGVGFAIVKDGEIIVARGFGYKDFEKKIPATADTQFAIGSSTKAFTALSVLMSADEGKVNLDDSPKKYLSYFKMKDPETDKNMTVRDLMAHTSGLNRTDLAMITNQLNRQELIQVVGGAEPMAKLREKFFYNNIMFAAAGEVTANVQKTTWEKFIPERIFKPLGMLNSTVDIKQLQKSKDYSYGYDYNFDTKETIRKPFMDISATAPAGSINSSARDMTKWLNFVIDGGVANGKRLLSEKGYEEWTKVQNDKLTPNKKVNYGLGWFLRDWNGLKVIEHGGNVDGFTSTVATIPEKKLGFVLFANASYSSLGTDLIPFIWETFLGKPEGPKTNQIATADLEKEVGKYRFEQAGFDVDVEVKDGKLVATIPNQPTVTLENIGGRKYKVKEQDGFFVTFKDDSLLFENQMGSFTFPKIGAKPASNPTNNDAAKELIGKYSPNGKVIVEIKQETDGKVTFNIEGQPPYALTPKDKDQFFLTPLPENYFVKVKRTAENKIESVVVSQPEGEFEFKKYDDKGVEKPKITVDELMAKAIEALGGEANWQKFSSRVIIANSNAIHQGVGGTSITYQKAPNKTATETTMTALGKTIAKGFEYFDGTNGEETYTFAATEKYTGKKLEDVKLGADFYSLSNWKKNYPKSEIKGMEKVGDEDCYVVDFTPEKGTKVTEYYSTKSFLLLKRKGIVSSSTSEQTFPYSITFSDYRDVDGIKLPFKTVNSTPTMGDIVTIITSVKHNVAIDDKMFMPRKVSLK